MVGYPWFGQTQSPTTVRDTVDMVGVVPVLSKLASGLLSVQVNYPPRELPPGEVRLTESAWSGISGAPVVADGLLIAVVSEHAPREGQSSITAVPLTMLDRQPAHPGWEPGVPDAAPGGSDWGSRAPMLFAGCQPNPSVRNRHTKRPCASSAEPCTRGCQNSSGEWLSLPRSDSLQPDQLDTYGWSAEPSPGSRR